MHKILLFFCVALLAASCKKFEVQGVDFNITTDKSLYKAGDTVNFVFTGNPDNITFYSGEQGFKYENKERVIATGTPQLTFTSQIRNGSQQNTLFLYASTDFSGKVETEDINAATWTDITSRATFSTGLDNTPSGIVNLTDFQSDKPVYLAFKYVGYAGSAQRVWNIKSFDVVNILPNEPALAICNVNNAGWISKNISGDIIWNIIAGQIYFFGPSSAAANAIANEDWIITKPLYLSKVYPDKGVPLKNMSSRLSNYQYVFKTPGTYKISFVASNMNVEQEQTVVKELTIEVAP